jgi:acyl dehydratase
MDDRIGTHRGDMGMEHPTSIKTIDELRTWVGKEVAVGRWITVTQDLINKFAEASGDYQWIHVDVERCKKESPFKTTIAHGNPRVFADATSSST